MWIIHSAYRCFYLTNQLLMTQMSQRYREASKKTVWDCSWNLWEPILSIKIFPIMEISKHSKAGPRPVMLVKHLPTHRWLGLLCIFALILAHVMILLKENFDFVYESRKNAVINSQVSIKQFWSLLIHAQCCFILPPPPSFYLRFWNKSQIYHSIYDNISIYL